MRGAEYVGALALVVWVLEAFEAVGVSTQASLLASALREGTLMEDWESEELREERAVRVSGLGAYKWVEKKIVE
jgi:hypothetical protein